MIVPGSTGCLVDGHPPDPARLAAAMVAYARDPSRREREGRAARAHVVEAFAGPAHGRAVYAEMARAAGKA